jgi:FkbM family methyltransferase
MEFVGQFDEEELYVAMLNLYRDYLSGKNNVSPQTVNNIISYHNKFPFWGSGDFSNPDNFLANRAHMLTAHKDEIRAVYELLDDYRSKAVYSAVIGSLINFAAAINDLDNAAEKAFEEYFDLDLFSIKDREVFVDCGAYDGKNCCEYYKYFDGEDPDRFMFYAYEITKEQIPVIKENLRGNGIKHFSVRQKAVSDNNGELVLSSNDDASANTVSSGQGGEVMVKAVRIDDDITEPITFLKMDIEGAEQAAIRGAARHIRDDKPKLGISIYHSYEDMWKIPLMIDEICPGYRFRLQSKSGNLVPTEIMLLCSHGR